MPVDWVLLPPGDATLTRRVKSATQSWTVKQNKGRRILSLGVWANKETIESERLRLEIERQDPDYKKRLQVGRARRAKKQVAYASEFGDAVFNYLDFHQRYRSIAENLARKIADHAVPVGSGTVARTQRIPIEKRAEAATIAWLRHQTTGYDSMPIPRVKGSRRETRRNLAIQSKRLLATYRNGSDIDTAFCPLQAALKREQPTPNTRPEQGQLQL